MSSLVLILLLAAAATACVSALIFALQRPRTNHLSGTRRKAHDRPAGRAEVSTRPAPATPHRLSTVERDEMLDGVKNLAENDPEKVAGLIRSWIGEADPPRN